MAIMLDFFNFFTYLRKFTPYLMHLNMNIEIISMWVFLPNMRVGVNMGVQLQTASEIMYTIKQSDTCKLGHVSSI